MVAPSDKAAWLQRERRMLVPAGVVTLIGVVLFVASVFIQSGTGSSDTDLELLNQYQEHGSTLLLGDIVGGLGFLCFSAPLYVLFRAAQVRAYQVRGALVAFAFIGPVLLAIQSPVQTIALENAADKFAEEAPAATVPAGAEKASAGSGQDAAGKGAGGGSTTAEQEAPAGAKAGEVTTTPTTEGGSTTTTKPAGGGDEDTAEENRAGDVLSDSGLVQFSRALIFPGLLGLVFALVYIPMWSMRVGLITRFWGTLGMALGVSLLLLPFAQLAVVLWFTAMAVLLLGRWPGGRPPAWDAGVAIPWLKPGDEAAADGDDAVEGQGREIPGDEPRDGGEPPQGANGTDPSGRGGDPPSGGGGDPRSGSDPGSGDPTQQPGRTYPAQRKRKRRS
jgi:hypothetical protein